MLNVNGIKKGIVLDHIKPGYGIKIFNFLHLDESDSSVALLINVNSKKMNLKDIIKIENDIKIDLDILGLLDPNITINIIKNEQIIKKYHPQIPKEIINIIKCKNPRCVTSVEHNIDHKFKLVNEKNKEYQCFYCDEIIKINHLLDK